jgi:hypothetical protein
MAKSKSKMRERRKRADDRYLAAWHQEIFEVVAEERDRRGLAPDGAAEVLTAEIARLAAPDSFPGLDAVVPGTRVDLARPWAQGRLDGVALDELARKVAPPPDAHLSFAVPRRSDPDFYVSHNKRLDKIRKLTERWIEEGAPPFDTDFRVESLASLRATPWANLL